MNGALRLHATGGGGGEGDMPTEGAHQVCGAVVDVRGGRLSGDELPRRRRARRGEPRLHLRPAGHD